MRRRRFLDPEACAKLKADGHLAFQAPRTSGAVPKWLALQIPQRALRIAHFPSALPWPAAPHGCTCVRKGSQRARGGSGAHSCRARDRRASGCGRGAGFANCNPDAQRPCRPRRRFRFLCRCRACIAHSPCVPDGVAPIYSYTCRASSNYLLSLLHG